jgi:hypothetical protein
MSPRRLLGPLVAACIASVVLAPAPAQALSASDLVNGEFSDCFWSIGAINGGKINIAYPDAGANYWAAQYVIPNGATLRIKGTFPHARYSSIMAYDLLGAVQDGIGDFQIDPDRGSVNPFRPGVPRDSRRRSFTLTLASDALTAPPDPDQRSNAPARNVLHGGAVEGGIQAVVWRVYVADRGRDLRGGVPLPKPELTLADGTVLSGQAACDALTSQTGRLPDPSALLISKEQYDAMRYQPGKPAYFPAERKPLWRVQYSRAYLLALWTGEKIENPSKTGQTGFFPNLHNQYMRAALNRKLGKVVAVRGTMATTPSTYDGDRFLKPTQLRYQSFCMNESPLTTRVMSCLFDEQIPLRKGRRYVVVTSRSEDRPRNARTRCGVAWVRWSPRGDGGRDKDFGWFQIRNMLPSPTFHNAVQDTKEPGDEKRVLGSYLPSARYYKDKRAFEKLGCPVK